MTKAVNITGQKFGRLTALYRVESRRYPSGGLLSFWRCRCKCGNEIDVSLSALRTGNTSSCGCLRQELVKAIHYTHGEAHSRLNVLWNQMRKRCNNPNDTSYKWYGAKGVKVCKEWEESYAAFRDWMLANGYDKNAERGKFTIDRINPCGNYEPSNCRLITIQAQQKNKRNDYDANSN